MADWAEAAATLVLGIIGVWLANNFRRQARAALTDRTADAHAKLWEITGRCPPVAGSSQDAPVRAVRLKEMLDRYFVAGNGMYLSTKSRTLFFAVLGTLGAEGVGVQPASARARLGAMPEPDREAVLSCLARRQLSLLRTQLKTDLAIYSERSTFGHLRPEEIELLKECGIVRPYSARLVTRFLSTMRSRPSGCSCGSCA